MNKTLLFLTLGLALLLTSCGGGGGGAPSPPLPQNFSVERDWARDASGHYDYTKQVVKMQWDSVNGASSYKIYKQREDESSPKFIDTTSNTSYTLALYDKDDLIKDITFFVSALLNGVEGKPASQLTSPLPPASPW